MTNTEFKKLVMAGPMRWIVLTTDGKITTLAWFVKVRYIVQGSGNVLFVRSDLQGNGRDDVFAVFSDNLTMAQHLRDDIFSYTVFAGVPDQSPPALNVEATFKKREKVRYLQDNVVAYQDQAWGDGESWSTTAAPPSRRWTGTDPATRPISSSRGVR